MAKSEKLYGGQISKHAKPPVEEAEQVDTSAIRINVRVSPDNLEFLKKKAKNSGSSVSALCGIAIAEYVDEQKAKQNQRESHYEDILTLIDHDSEFRKALKEYIDSLKK